MENLLEFRVRLQNAHVGHPWHVFCVACAANQRRKRTDVKHGVRLCICLFDRVFFTRCKVQAPCAVIFRDDIVFDTEGDLPCAAASTV